MENRFYKRYAGAAIMAVLASMIVFAFGVGTNVSAQTARSGEKKTAKAPASADAEGASAQQASIDPQTGKLRQPTREEAKKLAEEMKKKFTRSPESVNVVRQPNGTMRAELPEEYMDVMVVKINPDGTTTMECVTGIDNANEIVEAKGKTSDDAANSSAKPEAKVKKPVHKAAKKSARSKGRKE